MEGWETVIRIYCMKEEFIFNKKCKSEKLFYVSGHFVSMYVCATYACSARGCQKRACDPQELDLDDC